MVKPLRAVAASLVTERTMLLSFSFFKEGSKLAGDLSYVKDHIPCVAHTNVKHIPAAGGVQPQGCITGGAVLAFKLANILVEASLMRHMRAGELQDAFPPESVLQRLFTDGTLAANKGPLATVAVPLDVHHAGHITRSWCETILVGETATRPFGRVTTKRAT